MLLCCALAFTSLPLGYVSAEGENANISSNNIRNFSASKNATAPGEWSYLEASALLENDSIARPAYLTKGNGNQFSTDEYAADINNGNHVWYVKSDGSMASDTKDIAWNYTVDSDFANAKDGLNIKGTLTTSVNTVRLIILKTSDRLANELRGRVETLYDVTSDRHSFDFAVPSERWAAGNDIIFLAKKLDGNEWWVPMYSDFTVKALYVKQAEAPALYPEVPGIPYGSAVTLTSETPDASIYYTLDGSDPATSSTRLLYEGPFALADHTDVIACTEKENMERSYNSSKRYVMDYPIRDFLGVCNGSVSQIDGLKWTRFDIDWGWAEVEGPGIYNEEYLAREYQKILDMKAIGYTVLPVIGYSPMWAANKDGYEFVHKLTEEKYVYSPTVLGDDNQYHGVVRGSNKWGDSTWETTYTVNSKTQMREDAVPHWENFIRKVVKDLTAEPYNMEFFEIWNEAYPSSGFYSGDLDQYMQCIHNPAARVMREFENVKMVFGGWPCCGVMSEFVELLDRNDAWQYVDVFDIHYHPLMSMDYIYRMAQERGIENPMVWQSEMGFSSAAYYAPNVFPRTLRWALEKGMYTVNNDLVKLIWFANWSPDDPVAFGYMNSLIAGSRLTVVGEQIKAFAELFYVNKLGSFNNFKTTPYLMPELMEMISSAEGFLLNDNRAVIALHLVKQNSYSNLMSDMNGNGTTLDLDSPDTMITVEMRGISGEATIERVDCFGNAETLKYTTQDDGTIIVQVPTKDSDPVTASYNGRGSHVTTVYLTVEAEKIEDGNWTNPNY